MSNSKHSTEPIDAILVFPSDLGWMAAVVAGGVVKQLTFGHRLGCRGQEGVGSENDWTAWQSRGKRRRPAGSASSGLRRGRPRSAAATFPSILARSAISSVACWSSAGGSPTVGTMSYGELAAKAGSPRAARAVGNCMAAQQDPALGSMPSGGMLRRAARLLFRPRRHGDETPAVGHGIAVNWPRIG